LRRHGVIDRLHFYLPWPEVTDRHFSMGASFNAPRAVNTSRPLVGIGSETNTPKLPVMRFGWHV
jgi:tetratricopeptide (TPR) repeat protein